MVSLKVVARLSIPSVLGGVLAGFAGCGGQREYPADPNRGEEIKQARIAAYGKNGTPTSKPPENASSKQSAARRKAAGR